MRLILVTLRARRGPTALLFLLAVLAVAAGTAAPLYADSAARSVQRQQYQRASGAERAITIQGPVSGEAGEDGLDGLRGRVGTIAAGTGLVLIGGAELPGSSGPIAGEANHLVLVTRDEVCGHLSVRGRCATAAGEAVVPEAAADAMEVGPGAELTVRAPAAARRIQLTVVGVYRPVDVTEPYWAGRSDLAADARRQSAPVFVTPQTLSAARPQSVQARVDLVVLDPAALTGDPAALRVTTDKLRTAVPSGVTVTSTLPDLISRVRFERQLLTSGIAVGASQLVALCCLVLLLAASATAVDRRPEAALAVLRGARRRHWATLALGPTVVALLAAALAGYCAGWLGAWAARWLVFDDGTPPPVGGVSLALAGATVTVVLVAAVVTEWSTHRGTLLEALRRVPPRRRRWLITPTDLVAIALAGAAGYQLVAGDTTGGLAVAAPLLLTLACGLLAGRLVLPLSARIGAGLLHRGRLAGGLAALELARRPHARPLLTVVTVAVALAGLATCGADTTRRAMDERAALELGADRVLTVASGPAVTRAAVHAADPAGRWALAAARLHIGTHSLVAVQADRLAAVASWPASAPSAATVAAALRPAGNAPITVTGGQLTVSVTVVQRLDAPTELTLRLFEPDGTSRDASTVIDAPAGRRDYRIDVPGCTAGCRLGWLSFPSSPERLRLHGLRHTDADGEREVLRPSDFAAPARWRTGFTTAPGELRLVHGDDWLTAVYRPSDPRYIASELHLRLADGPVPLPVAAAGPFGPGTTELWLYGGGVRPVEVVTSTAGLPGAGGDGYLFDHEYAERLAGEPGLTGGGEVWLAAGTPEKVLRALRSTLPVTGEETVRQRADRLADSGAGQSARLHVLAALIGIVLAGGAVLSLAAAERRRRTKDLSALRAQGLPAATGLRAGRRGYAALVTGGLLAGLAATVANWAAARTLIPVFDRSWAATDPPVTPRPVVALLVLAFVAGVLLACARYAGHRLGREIS